MAIQPGGMIGRYQILSQLGQGGMATVYKAFQPSLDRTVALKVMRAGLSEDTEFKERFIREAKAIARLEHPNIVQVYDFDEIDGRAFMTMAFIDGGTLKDKLDELAKTGQHLPPREVARIVGQVADGLAYAHGLGIVHRDVKTSNVMLTRDGRAVVSDFGIAKILSGTQYTQAGVGIGTPEYMSPEQGQGKTVDARSDLYSLGVVAYEMMVGKVPFSADTPLAVVLMHVRDPLPIPSSVDPAVGQNMERVILKALAKDPSERYSSVTEFAAALQRAVNEDAGGTAKTVLVGGAAAAAGATTRVAARAAAAPAAAPAGASPLTQRPVQIAAAVIGLLVLGGAAFALTRGGPTGVPATGAAATPAQAARTAVTAVASAPPAAAPATAPAATGGAFGGPAKGALLYQLDPANPGAGGAQINKRNPADQVTTVGGTLQFDVSPGSDLSLVIGQPLQDVVVEATVRIVSGQGGFNVNVRGGQSGAIGAAFDSQGGSLQILRIGSQPPPQILAGPKPAGGSGDRVLAFAAVGRDLVLYLAGTETLRAQDASPAQGVTVFAATTPPGGTARFVLQLVSLKVYRAA